MAKKDKKDRMDAMLAIMGRYDPFVQKLAWDRFHAKRRSGGQLYDPNTHRLRDGIRDDAQALDILLVVREMAKLMNVGNFWFSKDEQKRLSSIAGSPEEPGSFLDVK